MAKKTAFVKKIDSKLTNVIGGGLPLIQTANTNAAPSVGTLPAPESLIYVSNGIVRSSQASLAYISVSWDAAPNISPDYYAVESSEDSTFTTNVSRVTANRLSATIIDLKLNTTYYFRVQAVQGGRLSPYSATLSASTPSSDPTPSPDVTGAAANFVNGNLVIIWSKPTSEIYKDAVIKIYNAARSVLYGTFYSGSQQLIWTLEQNLSATSGTALTSVSIDIAGRSWYNVNSTGVTITAASAVPSIPTSITTNWTSDNGRASQDLTISWLASNDDLSYDITIDSASYTTKDNRLFYPYTRNQADHIGTVPSGSANLAYTIKAKNRLLQVSTTASGLATNTAPSSSVLSLSTTGGFNQIAAQVSLLAGAIIQDFDHYNWRLAVASGDITVTQFNSTTPDVIFIVPSGGTYTVGVNATDKFNQTSSTVTSSGIIIDALTVAQLRSEAMYTDNVGNSVTTLSLLKDDDTTTGVTYNATASGVYNWTKVERATIDRYGVVSLFVVPSGSAIQTYLGISSDDITYSYYAGALSGTYGTILASVSGEAQAQSNTIADTDSGLATYRRLDIPIIKDARFVKVLHRSNSSYSIRTLYPRRIIETDDLRAENVSTINLKAAAVTADKISVINLAAVNANMGTLNMDGVISIGTNGGIYQGTGSFASPTTGLKIYNSGGIGVLATYSGGVNQISIDTAGVLTAGANTLRLSSSGITLKATTTFDLARAYKILDNTGVTTIGGLAGVDSTTQSQLYLTVPSISGRDAIIYITANAPTGASKVAQINIQANDAGGGSCYISLDTTVGATAQLYFSGTTYFDSAAYFSTYATFADVLYSSSRIMAGTDLGPTVRLGGRGSDSTASNYALYLDNSSAAALFHVRNDGILGIPGYLGVGATGVTNVRLFAHGSDTTSSNYALYVDDSASTLLFYVRNDGLINMKSDLYSAGTKVLGTRKTGWGTPTGTLYRTALTNSSTQTQFNDAIMAVITDLIAHGLIGA